MEHGVFLPPKICDSHSSIDDDFQFSGEWFLVDWCMGTSVAEELAASIFRVIECLVPSWTTPFKPHDGVIHITHDTAYKLFFK
jgi:hypothetical protein